MKMCHCRNKSFNISCSKWKKKLNESEFSFQASCPLTKSTIYSCTRSKSMKLTWKQVTRTNLYSKVINTKCNNSQREEQKEGLAEQTVENSSTCRKFHRRSSVNKHKNKHKQWKVEQLSENRLRMLFLFLVWRRLKDFWALVVLHVVWASAVASFLALRASFHVLSQNIFGPTPRRAGW